MRHDEMTEGATESAGPPENGAANSRPAGDPAPEPAPEPAEAAAETPTDTEADARPDPEADPSADPETDTATHSMGTGPESDAARATDMGISTDDAMHPDSARSDSGRSDDEARQLFRTADVDRFRTEWQQVQTMFVDDPRAAVQNADNLIVAVMESLASAFAEHKAELEDHWQRADVQTHDLHVQTEDLRIALRRYRSFLNQLLHT